MLATSKILKKLHNNYILRFDTVIGDGNGKEGELTSSFLAGSSD